MRCVAGACDHLNLLAPQRRRRQSLQIGEIDDLLDRRFGPPGAAPPAAPPVPAAVPAAQGRLTMTVAETADVLQLTEAQAKVLATLVRRVGVTIIG